MSGSEARGRAGVLPPDGGKELPFIGRLRASAVETGGTFELIEYSGPAVPPPHIHREHDELFYVVEGSFNFIIGDTNREAGAGSFIWVPRGTRHGFQIQPGSKALLFIIPAGLEGFFEELGKGLMEGRTSEEIRATLAGKYDSIPAPASK